MDALSTEARLELDKPSDARASWEETARRLDHEFAGAGTGSAAKSVVERRRLPRLPNVDHDEVAGVGVVGPDEVKGHDRRGPADGQRLDDRSAPNGAHRTCTDGPGRRRRWLTAPGSVQEHAHLDAAAPPPDQRGCFGFVHGQVNRRNRAPDQPVDRPDTGLRLSQRGERRSTRNRQRASPRSGHPRQRAL